MSKRDSTQLERILAGQLKYAAKLCPKVSTYILANLETAFKVEEVSSD